MAARRSFVKNGVRRISRWPSPLDILFITIENEVIYNLTVNQSVIRRYVEVIRTLSLFSLSFCAYFSTFLDITLVFVVITSWFTVDL